MNNNSLGRRHDSFVSSHMKRNLFPRNPSNIKECPRSCLTCRSSLTCLPARLHLEFRRHNCHPFAPAAFCHWVPQHVACPKQTRACCFDHRLASTGSNLTVLSSVSANQKLVATVYTTTKHYSNYSRAAAIDPISSFTTHFGTSPVCNFS